MSVPAKALVSQEDDGSETNGKDLVCIKTEVQLKIRTTVHTNARMMKTSSIPNHLLIISRVYKRSPTVIVARAINIELIITSPWPRVTGSV